MVPRAAPLLPALLALVAAAPAQWSDSRRVWSEEKPDSEYVFSRNFLAADGSGTFLTTWEEHQPNGDGTFQDHGAASSWTKFPADRWSTPQLVLGAPPPQNLMQWRPFVAASPDGTFLHFHIDRSLWNAYRVNVSRWDQATDSWSAPMALPDDPTVPLPQVGHESFDVFAAAGGNGAWIAAWQKFDPTAGDTYVGSDLSYCVSMNDGVTWSVPRPLHPPSPDPETDDMDPRLVAAPTGTWMAVWTAGVRGNLGAYRFERDVFVARSTDLGETWSEPVKINVLPAGQTPGLDFGAEAAVDSQGNWVVVWSALVTQNETQRTEVLFSRSTDGGMTWSLAQAIPMDRALASPIHGPCSAAFDAHGNLLLVLQASQTLTPVQEFGYDLVSVLSPDLGMRWSTPRPVNFVEGTPIPTNGYVDDITPRLGRSGDHDWLVTWIRNQVLFPAPLAPSFHHAGLRYTTGTLELNLSAEPAQIDFGTEYTHRPPMAWRNVAIRLPEDTLGSARPSGYSISNGFRYLDEFDFTPMLPGETRLLRVYFHPLESGVFEGTFEVFFDNPPASVSVPLRGVGAHPFHGLQVLGE